MKKTLFYDIIKCAKLAFLISLIISVFFGIIFFISTTHSTVPMLNFIKNGLYYIGCFGFLISGGFFIQRNANRPLNYNEKWRQLFSRLNLGLVIMFISLFICFYGMLIQVFIEATYR